MTICPAVTRVPVCQCYIFFMLYGLHGGNKAGNSTIEVTTVSTVSIEATILRPSTPPTLAVGIRKPVS